MAATTGPDGESPAVTRHRPWQRLRPVPLRAAAGLALVALGSGGALAAGAGADHSAVLVGRNAPLDQAAADPRLVGANNSPSLARNPTAPANLVAVNRVDLPTFSCALHRSFDAGSTWERGSIPFPDGEELPPRCFAPDAAFGPDGVLYVSFLTLKGLGNTPNAAWIATSEDGGRTLSTPTRVLGPGSFQVRLAADPTRAGRVWLAWLAVETTATLGFADPGNPVMATRSDDGGRTWGPATAVSSAARARAVAPSIEVGADGRPYVLFLDLGDDRLDYHGGHQGRGGEPYGGRWSLVLARSADDGVTWTESVVDPGVVPARRIVVQFPPSPSLAVDSRRTRVLVAFTDGRLGDADVWAWSSDDGGATFGPARRVNDTRRHDGTTQHLPGLDVAPDGRVDVVYLDHRRDRDDVMTDVSLQSSTDGGRAWGASVRLTDRAFDSRIGFGNERGLADPGSRLAVLSTADRALAVWSDTRAGTSASKRQDLARAVVAFGGDGLPRGPLVAGGVGVAAGGLALLVPVVVGARREHPGPGDAGDGGDGGES